MSIDFGQNKILKARSVLVGLVTLSFILAKLHWLHAPLDRDEGSYLYLGKCFIEGYRPYIDFYEIKPPGVFFVYGIFYQIFGNSIIALHIGLAMVQLLSSIIIFSLTNSMFNNKLAATIAFCIYLLLCLSTSLLSFGLNSEFFINLFFILSLYFLYRSTHYNTVQYLFVSGLCLAMCVMIRQQAVVFILPYIAVFFMLCKNKQLPIQSGIYIFLGFAMYVGLLISYVCYRSGFSEMYYWVWERPFSFYLENITWTKGKAYMLHFLNNFVIENYIVLICCLVGLIAIMINQKIGTDIKLFLTLLFIVSLIAIVPGFRFFPHYWIYLIPFLSLSASGLHLLGREKTMISIMLIFLTSHLLVNAKTFFITPAIQSYSNIYGKNPNIAVKKITDYIKKHANKQDKLYVFGSEPQVYFEADFIPNLRHVYVAFAFQPLPTDTIFQAEILDYLQKEKPKYILHVQNSLSVLLHPKSSKLLYEELFKIEESEYKPIIFAKINENHGNAVECFYGEDAVKQSIFEKNYVVLYQRKY